MLRLEPLLKADITLAPAQELGESPLGRRRIINITGGTFSGERLSGKVLPGGADWQIVRRDLTAEVEARYTLETHDGALIYVEHRGLRHGPAEVIRQLMEGEEVDSSRYYMRGAMRLETGDDRYAWLNRLICVTTGARKKSSVHLEIFEVK